MKLTIIELNRVDRLGPIPAQYKRSAAAGLIVKAKAYRTDDFSSTSLSFSPNLHSGVPERYARIRIWPSTSARRTVPEVENAADRQHCSLRCNAKGTLDAPVELISRLTVSITSTKASFLRYLTSARRQLVLPVAWMVILDESSRCDGACARLMLAHTALGGRRAD